MIELTDKQKTFFLLRRLTCILMKNKNKRFQFLSNYFRCDERLRF